MEEQGSPQRHRGIGRPVSAVRRASSDPLAERYKLPDSRLKSSLHGERQKPKPGAPGPGSEGAKAEGWAGSCQPRLARQVHDPQNHCKGVPARGRAEHQTPKLGGHHLVVHPANRSGCVEGLGEARHGERPRRKSVGQKRPARLPDQKAAHSKPLVGPVEDVPVPTLEGLVPAHDQSPYQGGGT